MLKIGIDEAGYGPDIGPLVISASVFTSNTKDFSTSLETALNTIIRRLAHTEDGKLVVDDSKKVYSLARGFGILEETALAFMNLAHSEYTDLEGALTGITAFETLSMYPWYKDFSHPLNKLHSDETFNRKRDTLDEVLLNNGLTFDCLIAPTFAAQYNAMLNELGNKQMIVLMKIAEIITALMRKWDDDEVLIYLDKLGGRMYYSAFLSNVFPMSRVTVVSETPRRSSYTIHWRGKSVRCEFSVGAEEKHLSVALASMFSKYTREVFMQRFNSFWSRYDGDVKPTAGYPADSTRFLNDIRPVREKLALKNTILYRTRMDLPL